MAVPRLITRRSARPARPSCRVVAEEPWSLVLVDLEHGHLVTGMLALPEPIPVHWEQSDPAILVTVEAMPATYTVSPCVRAMSGDASR